MKTLITVLTLLLLPWGLSETSAQEKYPSKPIKLIVPLGPGTVNDVVARTVGEALSRDLKTEITVEYRAGAGGVVGSDFLAKSSPDGHTLGVLNSSALTNSPAMMDKPPYDPLRDFTPIANVGAIPALLAINAASPWKTLEEFLTHARKNPGKVNCGTSGVGTSGHFNLELLKGAAGVQINHVPYKGGSPQNITALLGGHIDCASQVWSAVAGQVKGGKLRVLAVTSQVREFPQLPTFAQSGFPQVTLEVSFSFFGPANLPKEVAAKLVSAFEKAIKDPETSAKLEKAGFPVAYEGPKELSERIARELNVSREVARKAGIRPE
jgi:tripartite-type tricarboxylate transporter receptor subunit TctC